MGNQMGKRLGHRYHIWKGNGEVPFFWNHVDCRPKKEIGRRSMRQTSLRKKLKDKRPLSTRGCVKVVGAFYRGVYNRMLAGIGEKR